MLRSGLHVFMYLVLFTAAQLCWNRKWAIPKRFPQSWEDEIVQNVLLWWALTVPFTGIKRPNSWKPNVPHGTVQSDKYCSPGNFQTQTHPLIRQTENCDLSLQRNRSTAPELSGGIVYMTNTNIVLGDVRLDEVAHPWKPAPWSSLYSDLELTCRFTSGAPMISLHVQWHKGIFYLLTPLSHFVVPTHSVIIPLWTCCIIL